MKSRSFIIKSAFIFCLLLGASAGSRAQVDPHFSQYYAYPLWLNPAMTGVSDGDYRAGVNIKNQWGGLSKSFFTGGASFDMAANDKLAFGATVLNQRAGELSFNYLTALVSASYRIRFGHSGLNIVSFGLQGGIINRSFDASSAQFGSDFNPVTGMGSGSSEAIMSESATIPDVNAGVLYFDGNPDQVANVFLGVSAAHLTRPTERFLGSSQRLPMRLTAHGGARFRVSQSFDIVPNALAMFQGNAEEIAAGAYGQLALNQQASLLFGGNYRFDDAGIVTAGIQYKNLVLGISYDINTSSLRTATNRNGGLEVSISLVGRNGLIGPNFFCPRL
ncbi:PorP/SprF family type IX secretion system membrane protein [Pedobacter sp. SYP-B3415]|uniref:PorP/SprF family type IX secretion system membrane protein n=1 Tax=Pedobacter sp. SYP-B3415 TaxID=2496641 RepID=UPI00101D9684|nr:PorP/SprF family type IX secretion system membrane protein [Pedobacter sp. SYP-B3415]